MRDLRSKLDRLMRGKGRKKGSSSSKAKKKDITTKELKRTIQRQKQAQKEPSSDDAIIYRRDLPRSEAPARPQLGGRGPKVALNDAVEGREVECPGLGKSFLIATRTDKVDGAGLVSNAFEEDVTVVESNLCKRLRYLCDPKGLTPADFVFMDLETTGLGNSPLFLIGLMVWRDGGFEIQQHLARNYAEEPASIMQFVETCADKKVLVTFNGKSFDVPFLRTRAAANGLPFDSPLYHFDLLHESRRVWKEILPDCKLQTLERHVCRRVRTGDIPGSEIPEAYHAYVRTENARDIVVVLKHNLLDLVTLADLMTRFPA